MLNDKSGAKYWNEQEEELIKIIEEKENNETPKIYCFGDCLTLGINYLGKLTSYNYPLFLQEELKEKYQIINLGRTKLRVESLLNFHGLFMPKSNSQKDIACVWCGTNDLYAGIQPEIVFNWFNEFCNLLKEKNIKIIAIAILYRDADQFVAKTDFEERRIIFNDLLKSKYKKMVDLNPLDENDWDEDHIHINENGYKMLAEKIAEIIKKN